MNTKAIGLVLTFLSVLSLIGVGILNYFATTSMGMIRWLNFQNTSLDSSMPVFAFKIILIVIAVGLAIFIGLKLNKNRKTATPTDLITILANFICLVAFLYVTLGMSTATFRIYYFAILLTWLATFFLAIRNIISLPNKIR